MMSGTKIGPNRLPPNAGHGRPRGVPNKVSGFLKEAILRAAEVRGSDGRGKDGLEGYCQFLAAKEPRAFAQLLGKVLPMQVSMEGITSPVVPMINVTIGPPTDAEDNKGVAQ
jgi:hypothetical protein